MVVSCLVLLIAMVLHGVAGAPSTQPDEVSQVRSTNVSPLTDFHDLLSQFKQRVSYQGIIAEREPATNDTIWRVRPKMPPIRKALTSFGRLQSQSSSGFSLFMVGRQTASSSGTLLTLLSGRTIRLSVTSLAQSRQLKVRYVDTEGSTHIVIFPTPLSSEELVKLLLVFEPSRMLMFVDCNPVEEITLEETADLVFPENTILHLFQTGKAKNKFNGWVHTFELHNAVLQGPIWDCIPLTAQVESEPIAREVLQQDEPISRTSQHSRTSSSGGSSSSSSQSFTSSFSSSSRRVSGSSSRVASSTSSQTGSFVCETEIALLENSVLELTRMLDRAKEENIALESQLALLETCDCKVEACIYDGKVYENNQQWYADPCTICQCQEGSTECSMLNIPGCTDPCALTPCLNGGTCIGNPGYQNFTCLCPPSCSGNRCQHMINVCAIDSEYGECTDRLLRYYYNPFLQRCVEFVYSGCGGNGNNFLSYQACQDQCLVGSCCYRTYQRLTDGEDFLAFTRLIRGHRCEELSLAECRLLGTINPASRQRKHVTSFRAGMSCDEVECGSSDTCTVDGIVYQEGEVMRKGCQTCRCVTGGKVVCRCDNLSVRKEIRDMTREEIDRFQDAVRVLRGTSPGNSWEVLRDTYITHVMEAHSLPLFLLWHRIYLNEVEKKLQEVDCSVTIPYFDFTTDTYDLSRSIIWQPNYFGGNGDANSDGCVPDHPFRNDSRWLPCLVRSFQLNGRLPSKLDIALAMASDDYASFSECLQMILGQVYSYIGGHIATSAAPYDPLFLPIQAYADMLFWQWQKTANHIDSFPQFLLDVPMMPFNLEPQDVMQLEHSLCVTYTLPSLGAPCNYSVGGFNDFGFDADGYNRNGFNRQGFDRFGYNAMGFNRYGQRDTRDIYIYNTYSFEGYNRSGYDRRGYNRYGYSIDGYSRDGYDIYGYDRQGLNRYGLDQDGFDFRGYNLQGYDQNNRYDRSGYYESGYDYQCLDRQRLDRSGFDRFGFNLQMSRADYCTYGFHGPHDLSISIQVDALLFAQSKEFLMAYSRTCSAPSREPIQWYDQTWTARTKPFFRLQVTSTQFPQSVFSQRFCFDIEPLLTRCPCRGEPVICERNPCKRTCGSYPDAVCYINFCDGCFAEWYLDGERVNCDASVRDCSDGFSRYREDAIWRPDPCTTCRCSDGSVECEVVRCPRSSCSHPHLAAGDCCPTCDGCQYGEYTYANGQTFNAANEPCSECTCINGNVECSTVTCPAVTCDYPWTYGDRCCPSCDGCVYDGRVLRNGQAFSYDTCTMCRCENGDVSCDQIECAQLSCDNQINPEGSCCPRCRDGCEYEGMSFNNGMFFTPMSNPCLQCSCRESIVRCHPLPCDPPACENPIYLLGACCPVCTNKCVHDGKQYDSGDVWLTTDQCEECYCRGSEVSCRRSRSCPQTCEHGLIEEGQCCSSCTDCLYNGQAWSNFAEFPNEDGCKYCSCYYGTVTCRRKLCDAPSCSNPVLVPGECCPSCKECEDRFGNTYGHGEKWTPLSGGQCEECICQEGQIVCGRQECTQSCTHPIYDQNACCPICDGCYFQGREYANSNPVYTQDTCETCVCRDGSVLCAEVECPEPPCRNPTRVRGECCPQCPQSTCEYEGQTYLNNEEFVPLSDPCLRCVCRSGRSTCQSIEFQCDIQCTHPVREGGQCCSPCRNCDYEGRIIPNGANFMDPSDNCQICTCSFGSIFCESQECPELTCSNPTRNPDECCPQCPKCYFEGREYEDNSPIRSRDPCQTCQCIDGSVVCSIVDCPPLRCSNPIVRAGQCCLECPVQTCEYEGRTYEEEEEFGSLSDPCLRCICRSGEAMCISDAVTCLSQCTHPVTSPDQCCPDCYDCYYLERRVSNGATFPDPDDDCRECTCQYGSVECAARNCPRTACSNPVEVPGECCPQCIQCIYEGREYENDAPVYSSDPCETCVCRFGEVICARANCPQPQCPNPVEIPGRCCPECPSGCDYEGQRYSEGENFISVRDPCDSCVCRSGRVNCVSQASRCITSCSHPVIVSDECCPQCLDCSYLGRTLRNGDGFRNPEDRCQVCECEYGSVTCNVEECPQVSCSNPRRIPGECCSQCTVCVDDGQEYEEGATWTSMSQSCTTCSCVDGRTMCEAVACPTNLPCTHPARSSEECCSECNDCFYDRRHFLNGQISMDPLDSCRVCECQDGNMLCEPRGCPELTCTDRYLPEGECCVRCAKCEHDGREFDDGEIFPSPNDPCFRCQCYNGIIGCGMMEECPPANCPHPQRVDCCPVCSGCEYNGYELSNREERVISEECAICTCTDGAVNCIEDPDCAVSSSSVDDGSCEFNGEFYYDEERFTNPRDPCVVCLCFQGKVQCDEKPCSLVSCIHPRLDGCCLVCDNGCTYLNETYEEGERFKKPDDPCQMCTCQGGNLICNIEECPPLPEDPDACDVIVEREEECCPLCLLEQTEMCFSNGIRYHNGEIFKNYTSCQQCQCLDTISCANIPCREPRCSHPVTIQCCPSCIGCLYHNEKWVSGSDFADPEDDCGVCRCENGNVFCQKAPCPPLDCPHQTQLENTCCPTCIDVDCEYGGTTYRHGTVFPHISDECQECSCNDGEVYCQRISCNQPECPYPIRGPCCETCDGCYFTGVEYSSGEIFEDPTTPCQECECQSGFIRCVEVDCPEPPCGYPVKLSGECCSSCRGCYFGGRSYRNGETFSHPENACQMCDCQFGNVTCEKASCPFVSCEYPTEDECGCPICDGCTYRGVEYQDGMAFPDPQDSCRECSCLKGYINCQPIVCPQPPCFHPALQPGQCCETCDSCEYEGQTYQNGQEFTDSVDTCRICTCLDGNVNCGLRVCGRVACLHPMMDECNCAVCDGCMYEDVMVMSGETFTDPNDMCRDCLCERGTASCYERGCPPANCSSPTSLPGECCPVCLEAECLDEPDPCGNCVCVDGSWDCERRSCPEVTCPHPGQGMCCLECDGCTYGGKPWANQDTFPDPSDGCGTCSCELGFVVCEEPVCEPADCPNPTIPAGTCCPVCIGQCTVDGVKYNNGEDFIPPGDRCQRCTCRNGQAFCSAVECSRLCGHPRTVPGQCCPVCDGCSFEGVDYNNAVQFISPVDNCHSCTCFNGNVECEVIECPELTCPTPIGVPGECCPTCQECTYSGRTYIDGSTFPARGDPCRECTCQGTRVRCRAITCDNSDCTHPVPGACCPLCDSCLFEDVMYNNGQTFRPDNCRICNCLDGNVICTSEECPELSCRNRVRDPGQCCDRCQGCLHEGFEYGSGESWVSPLDLCVTCQCQDGVTMCSEIRCLTPDFCTNPVNVPGQCCPICPGCSYNGITYQNGQSFHPYEDACETCICEHGSLTCVRQSCPTLNDCPPNAILPPELGECCGSCSTEEGQRVCDVDAIGSTFRPYSDPCFTCHCTNSSTWECMQDMCPMLMCPRSERFKQRDECCPKCQRCVEEDSGASHLTGQTWRKAGNPCILCTCDFGAINCQLEDCPKVECQEGFEAAVPNGLCCPECRNIQIPCYYQGVQYVNGQSWSRDECTRCHCLEGEVQCETRRCQALFCDPDEVPTLDPGSCCPRCIPRPATCIAFGDPHYRTFDGKLIHFQGTCRYIMSMDCTNQDFIVEVKNSNRGVGGSVSWTEEVSVIVDGVQVDLGQSGLVKVDREVIVPPYLKDSSINIERRGDGYYVNTNVGVKVTWDGSSYVEISIPGSYARRTCGLCGNFNGYHQDDLRTRADQIVSSVALFGNSWKVPGAEGQDCDAEDIDPCDSAGYYVRNLANVKCSTIKSPRFARCHGDVPPEPYYAACVYDLCACSTGETCLCDAVAAYAAECRNAGIMIDWRDGTLCPIDCPKERGFLFDECGPACPRTCVNKDIPVTLIDEQCIRPCVPGCQCPAHKVLHSGACIDADDCPVDYRVNATIIDVGHG